MSVKVDTGGDYQFVYADEWTRWPVILADAIAARPRIRGRGSYSRAEWHVSVERGRGRATREERHCRVMHLLDCISDNVGWLAIGGQGGDDSCWYDESMDVPF